MTSANAQRRLETDIYFELATVFCLLVSLGFPGGLTNVLGGSMQKLMEYGAFLLEIVMLLFSSSGDWRDVELVHLDKKYVGMYLFVFSCFGISMLVTGDSRAQLITCLRLVVTMLFVIWLQERFRISELLELTCIAQGVFVLATLALVLVYPQYALSSAEGKTNALVGLYETKNACGTELDFGIIMTVLLLRDKQRVRRGELKWWILLFTQFVLLLMCKASGAVLAVVVALLVIFLSDIIRFPLGLFYIVANVVFLFAMLALMPLFEDILVAMGKDATLTGRIPLWRRIIEVMTETHTMTGFGYGMFWRDPDALIRIHTGFRMREDPFMVSLTTGAHNVIFEMWANSGLLGIAAFFFMLLHAFRDEYKMDDNQYGCCAGIMAFLTVNGLTERCLGGNYDYRVLAIFLAVAVASNAAGSSRRKSAAGNAAKS